MKRTSQEIALPGPSPRVVRKGGTLVVTIPARRDWMILGFLTLWLVVSAQPGFRAWSIVLSVSAMDFGWDGVLAIAAMGGMTLLWLGGLAAATWMALGRETAVLSPDRLLLGRQVLLFRKHAIYEVSGLGRLSVAPQLYDAFAPRTTLRVLGLVDGTIVFSYQGKDRRFGGALPADLAGEVVGQMEKYLASTKQD